MCSRLFLCVLTMSLAPPPSKRPKRLNSEAIDDIIADSDDIRDRFFEMSDDKVVTVGLLRPLLSSHFRLGRGLEMAKEEIKMLRNEISQRGGPTYVAPPDRDVIASLSLKQARTDLAVEVHKFDNSVKVLSMDIKSSSSDSPTFPEIKDAINSVDPSLPSLLANATLNVIDAKPADNGTIKSTFTIDFNASNNKGDFIKRWRDSKTNVRTSRHFSKLVYPSVKEIRELVQASSDINGGSLKDAHIRILPSMNQRECNVNVAVRSDAGQNWSQIGHIAIPIPRKYAETYKNLPKDQFLIDHSKLKIKVNEQFIASKPEIFKAIVPVVSVN